MEEQKITNFLKETDDNNILKFQTRKWYIINDQNNRKYGKGDENDSTIKFNTEVIKPNLCDYSDAYILVTGDIAVANENNDTLVCFKNCSPFARCVLHLNDEHVESAENLDLIIELYNLTEFSDNYSDSIGTLFQFRRNEKNLNAAGNIDNVNSNDSNILLNTSQIYLND